MLLSIQSCILCFFERAPAKRFELSCYACASSILILIGLIVGNSAVRDYEYADEPLVISMAAQAGFVLIATISLGSIDRRPEVFSNGKPVDGQYTVSLWAYLIFSWAQKMLSFTRNNKGIELKDLPALPNKIRAETLSARFNASRQYGRLWKSLFIFFLPAIFKQLTLSIVFAVVQFAPSVSVFMILRLLEQRTNGSHFPAAAAWAWAFGLGVAMLAQAFTSNWLYFIIFGEIATPVRNLLSTLVFEKSLRKKDAKSTSKSVHEASETSVPSVVNGENISPDQAKDMPKDKKDEDVDEKETEEKTRQGVVNLIGVDSKRVADWLSFTHYFWNAPIKIAISFGFLYTIIGGVPLLAGLGAFAVTLPLNIWLSRKYTKVQVELMSLRDEKLRVVTECLQGIRQIKFTATEDRWEARIQESRQNELKCLRRMFSLDVGLVFIWIWSPVMLSAASVCPLEYSTMIQA